MEDKEILFVFKTEMKKLSLELGNCSVTSPRRGFTVLNVASIEIEYDDRNDMKYDCLNGVYIILRDKNSNTLAAEYISGIKADNTLILERNKEDIQLEIGGE